MKIGEKPEIELDAELKMGVNPAAAELVKERKIGETIPRGEESNFQLE